MKWLEESVQRITMRTVEGGTVSQGLVLKFSKPTAAMNSPHPSLAFHNHIEGNHQRRFERS